jgi:hypothetical protein
LRQTGLANESSNLAFLLLDALAFGLDGREPAQREVERFFQALHNRWIGAEP